MSERPRRAVLHQRSQSETNELPTSPSTRSLALSTVSQKTEDVSPWRLPRTQTENSENSATGSSAPTTRSNTIRSGLSLDSLPPVPPLKISKQKSIGTLRAENHQTPVAHSTPEPGSSSYVQSLPRSILKRPPGAALPPHTSAEYQRKSSLWDSDPRNLPIVSRARMNSRTLRLVDNDDPIRLRSPTEGSSRRYADVDNIPRERPDRTSSAGSLSRVAAGPSGQSAFARQFPAWARYFYGKRGGRASFIEPGPEDEDVDNEIGVAVPHPGPGRMQGDPMAINNAAVHGDLPPPDPESITLWSLPHLDGSPLTHLETPDRQVVLFILGFLMPVCWIVAAFLPLPKSRAIAPTGASDVESGMAEPSAGAMDDLRVANARWWRRINRVLSVVGLAIIGAVIALAVIATHA